MQLIPHNQSCYCYQPLHQSQGMKPKSREVQSHKVSKEELQDQYSSPLSSKGLALPPVLYEV